MTNEVNELLESALEYASNGMLIFPVHTPTGDVLHKRRSYE